MARQQQHPSKTKKEKKWPSPFGSHQSMVVENLTYKLDTPELVVCEDEKGLYVTYANRLDNKLADPNRYSSKQAREDVKIWIAVIQVCRVLTNGALPGKSFWD